MDLNRPAASAWFGAGLGLTTATQLRLPGLPLGPGEAMLALWALAAAVQLARRGPMRISAAPLPRRLLAFWAVSAAAMAIGRAVAVARGYAPANGSAMHDTVAYAFVAAVLLSFTIPEGLPERSATAFGWMLAVVVPPAALLAMRTDPVFLGPLAVDGWHRGRLRGVSANPNQLALALLLAPFAGIVVARMQRRREVRAALGVLVAAAAVLGWITASDALQVSWILAAGVAAGVVWLRAAREARPGTWARRTARIVVPALLAAAVAAYGPAAARRLQAHADANYRHEQAGATRAALLRYAVDAWGRSPVVGLGPGAHSGLEGPFGGGEAHNLVLDWGMSAGVAGVAALAALLAWAGRRIVRGRNPALAAGYAALLAFSLFHHVLRHPVFWIGLVALVALAERGAAESAAEGAGGRGA